MTLLLLAALALAAPAAEEATARMAEGRPAEAIPVLRRALAAGPDAELSCLLARAAMSAGRPGEALGATADVPADAPCARVAAALRADALLALGRTDEAAAAWEALGEASLGAERHADMAERLAGWAAAATEDDPDHARALLVAALALETGPARRLALSRALADLGGARGAGALAQAIAAGTAEPADRLRLAPLLAPAQGLALLADAPPSPAVAAARARVGARASAGQGWVLATAAIAAFPDAEETAALRLDLGREAVARGDADEAEALLGPLLTVPEGAPDAARARSARAAAALATLAARTAQPDALSRIEEVLRRFPTIPERRDLERARDVLALDAARRARDPAALAALAARRPDDASLALEAALAEDGETRLRRLAEVAARWPRSAQAEAALRARVTLDPTGGWDWLEARAKAGDPDAAQARDALATPEIALRSPGRQDRDPTITLVARGAKEVELRLHRVDLDGYVRAGRSPDDLDDLDVGIIRPDRTWKVDLGDSPPGLARETSVPLPIRTPGLYAVTAALPDREARALVLVSDTELLARTVGGSLLAVAIRDGRPVPGARFLAVGARSVEGRAGADGLARLDAGDGRIVVLAETPGGPAVLAVDAEAAGPPADLRWAVDLDRPVYRPGDTVRFRAFATRAGATVRGAWTFELHGRETLQSVRLETDARGAVVGEVTLPDLATFGRYELHARAPGADEGAVLAAIEVAPTGPLPRRLVADGDGVRAVDGDGVPLVGAVVLLERDGEAPIHARTDKRGRVSLPAVPAGLEPRWRASLPGGGPQLTLGGPPPPIALAWAPSATTIDAEAPATLRLEGEDGSVRVEVLAQRPGLTPAPPIALPDPFAATPTRAYDRLVLDGTSPSTTRRVWTADLTVADGTASVTLPPLPPGAYHVRATRTDGRAAATTPLQATGAVRAILRDPPRIGGTATIDLPRGWALVTAEQGGLIDAAIVPAGTPWRPRLDARWHGTVALTTTTVEGVTQQELTLDATLQVDLAVEAVNGRWIVRGNVRDPAGAGRQAQVVLRALDPTLIAARGEPRTADLSPFLRSLDGSSHAAVARTLLGAAASRPIAGALLAEAARQREQARAAAARSGVLGSNQLAGLFDEDFAPEAEGLGGLGTSGYGRGGGGSAGHVGYGSGRSGRGRVDVSVSQPPPGVREVGLWRVIDTDAQGSFVLDAPAPANDIGWRLDAVALADGALGAARHEVAADPGPRLVLDPLAPGWPGDVARPQARVIAGTTPIRGTLRVDGADIAPVALGAGEVTEIPLPPLPAGRQAVVTLETGAGAGPTRTVAFPLAPALPAPDGPVVVSLVGRIGGTPLGAIALEVDPWGDAPVRRAAAGLALVAALPSLAGEERAVATRRLRAIVGAVREAPVPREAAAAAASLLLVARAAPVLGFPTADVDGFAASIAEVEATTPRERLDLAFARAVAGADVSDATLGRLVREAERLDAEGRSRLARLLPRVGERPDPSWIAGDGPEAALAAREVRGGRAPVLDALLASPPPLGDPARATWIEAVGPALAAPADPRSATPDGIVRGDAAVPGARSWREAPPAAAPPLRPGPGDGLPARVPVAADGLPNRTLSRGPTCGTPDDPCRVPLGGGLLLPGQALAAQGGLVPLGPSTLVVARAPGEFRVALRPTAAGAVPTVHVVVDDDNPTALGADGRVQAATLADARAEDPRPVLGEAPLSDWPAEHRPDVARLRFTWTDAADPAGRVAAFEDLRDEAPSSTLALDEIAATARAFRAIGRPDRAIALWRRVIGQDALAGLAVGRSLEQVSGRLAAIQALREATRRAPPVEEVRSAAFALPDRLLDLADDLPPQALDAGVTPSDARLEAAAWDRSFLAWFPDSPEAPEAGLRLANTLYALGARAAARDLAADLRARHPDHALVDRWLLLEGVAHLELSDATAATRALRRLADEDLPLGGGRVGPSSLRDDARFALGRLAEARDDVAEAVRWYGAASSVPDAATARAALTAKTLTAEPVLRLPARGPTRVGITAANVEEAMVSAYAIDLRTVFLREAGLPRPDALRVEGLAPVHTRARRIGAGPFPTTTALDLPLEGAGAWLVRVDADGVSTATIVIRSDLQLASSDDEHRRLSARRDGRPVPGASVRALVGSGAFAAETDARGIASVPSGAPSLVWDGAHLAVTDDARPGATRASPARRPSAPAADPLQRRLEEREKRRRGSNLRTYDFIGDEVDGALEVEGL